MVATEAIPLLSLKWRRLQRDPGRAPDSSSCPEEASASELSPSSCSCGLSSPVLCVFSPEGFRIPLAAPWNFFLGRGSKALAVVARPRPWLQGPPAMASRAPSSTLASVCPFHSRGPCPVSCPSVSWGASRVLTLPPRWKCYSVGRALREGGVMSVLCRVCLVFPPLVSLFGLFPFLVECDY